jgi:formate hydrogenlyase subunit 4
MNIIIKNIAILIVVIAVSPLLSGIITKIKNWARFRRGPGIFQPYYNLAKYFSKEEVVSEHASWIFRTAPYIILSSAVCALMFLSPMNGGLYGHIGDIFAAIFLLAVGRFFLSLAGLDPATTFGGMGSSREMFISSFVEPVLILAVFAVALSCGTTSVAAIAGGAVMSTTTILAAAAIYLVTLAESSRIPVDNQETHLELTMIHEAMVLEYSGRSLALVELAAYVKQAFFFLLLSMLILPGYGGIAWLFAKLLALCVCIAFTEISMSKMRLFRVVDFLSFAGILSVLAVIAMVLGV